MLYILRQEHQSNDLMFHLTSLLRRYKILACLVWYAVRALRIVVLLQNGNFLSVGPKVEIFLYPEIS